MRSHLVDGRPRREPCAGKRIRVPAELHFHRAVRKRTDEPLHARPAAAYGPKLSLSSLCVEECFSQEEQFRCREALSASHRSRTTPGRPGDLSAARTHRRYRQDESPIARADTKAAFPLGGRSTAFPKPFPAAAGRPDETSLVGM